MGWQRGDAGSSGTLSPLLPSAELRRGSPPASAPDPRSRAGSTSPVPVGWSIAKADGWYAIGGTAGSPERLVYVRCTPCMDAGLRVVFERGRGLVSVRATTIAGSSEVLLLDRDCATGEA